jgi:septal ring factor EnvC (AmiA/AmiB activator)
LRVGFNNLCKAKFPIGDNAPLAMMQDMAAGRGRVFIACQEINAKYQGAIDAIANNQYYTKEQRDAIIAALRAQQKAEITATRQRIQHEEKQKMKAQHHQHLKPKR